MRRTITTALLALLLAPPAAQAAAPGMFSITPARRDVTATPPLTLSPTLVGNTTDQTYTVRVFPVLLKQTRQGPFDFVEQPAPLRAAANVLSVSPRTFTLKAHSTRQVRLRWHALPPGRRAISLGIVFQGTPPSRAGAPVRTVTRILSLNFLRTPKAKKARGALTAVAARPDPLRRRGLQLVATVANRGGSVGLPCHAQARVRDAQGDVIRRVRFRGDVIAPQSRREFTIPLKGTLPAGTYRAAVSMCFGRGKHGRRLHGATRFRLVGPGLLPSPALSLSAFNAGGNPGETAHARGTLRSTGTAAARGTVVVRLYHRDGTSVTGRALKTVKVDLGALKPGQSAKLDAELGDLDAGQYRATATYLASPGTPQTEVSDFTPVQTRSAFSLFIDWLKDSAGWLLAAVLGVALLVSLARGRRTAAAAEV